MIIKFYSRIIIKFYGRIIKFYTLQINELNIRKWRVRQNIGFCLNTRKHLIVEVSF